MLKEFCKILLACFNVRKLEPICDTCKKELFNQVILVDTKTEDIKYFCEECAEKEYLF